MILWLISMLWVFCFWIRICICNCCCCTLRICPTPVAKIHLNTAKLLLLLSFGQPCNLALILACKTCTPLPAFVWLALCVCMFIFAICGLLFVAKKLKYSVFPTPFPNPLSLSFPFAAMPATPTPFLSVYIPWPNFVYNYARFHLFFCPQLMF